MSETSQVQQIQVFLATFTGFIGVTIAIAVSLVQHWDACQHIADAATYIHMVLMSLFSSISVGALVKANQLALNV